MKANGEIMVRGIRVCLRPEQVLVMTLLAQGCTYRQIGWRLDLSYGAVRKRVKMACCRLGAQNRTEAIALLAEAGVIHADTVTA